MFAHRSTLFAHLTHLSDVCGGNPGTRIGVGLVLAAEMFEAFKCAGYQFLLANKSFSMWEGMYFVSPASLAGGFMRTSTRPTMNLLVPLLLLLLLLLLRILLLRHRCRLLLLLQLHRCIMQQHLLLLLLLRLPVNDGILLTYSNTSSSCCCCSSSSTSSSSPRHHVPRLAQIQYAGPSN